MNVIPDIIVRNPDHCATDRFQIFSSGSIIILLFLLKMRITIHFNTQFQLRAIKINDKPFNWMLATELVFQVSISKMLPQGCFRHGLRLAHFTSALENYRVKAMPLFHCF